MKRLCKADCKRAALPGTDYCLIHIGEDPKYRERIAEKRIIEGSIVQLAKELTDIDYDTWEKNVRLIESLGYALKEYDRD